MDTNLSIHEKNLKSIKKLLGTKPIIQDVRDTIECLTDDGYWYRYLLDKFDIALKAEVEYWEIRIALRTLSRVIKPRNYLEIGTRRGWSLAQVLIESPTTQAFLFDIWMKNYGGVQNPGPGFVKRELSRCLNQELDLTFVSGNSHDTLPENFLGKKQNRLNWIIRNPKPFPETFDLVTVDGDHSILGAWWDLCDTFPLVSIGGALVFDDLNYEGDERRYGTIATTRFNDLRPPLPLGLNSLLEVWMEFKRTQPGFVFIENLDDEPSIGIAFRMK
ncbi:MAG: class I SAM-dependent methyltransferase [Chloroflexota bacterium]